MKRIRRVFRLRDVDGEVDEEIAFHLAMREARLCAQGLSAPDAARIARDRFGSITGIREACLRESVPLARWERTMLLLDELRRDVQFGIRSLLRSKGFTLAVILTLALGIGTSTTVFSLINALLLRPITGLRASGELFELDDIASYPLFRDLRTSLPALGLAAVRERRIALGNDTGADHTLGALVSGNFFAQVGALTVLGRPLSEADDVAGTAPVGVLAYDYWVRNLGADGSILGRVLTVNGSPVTIVGVTAKEFRGLHLGAAPAVWLPLESWRVLGPSSARADLESRNRDWLRVVGRLGQGMTLAQAESALATAMRGFSPDARPVDLEKLSRPRPLQAAALASRERDALVRFMGIVGGVVMLVLLTACANIAGLLLSRAAYREREVALRIALGAGRGRLVRQLLTEALVLASAGGVAGVALFAVVRAVLSGLTLPGGITGNSFGLALDARLVAFAIAVTIGTGLLVGLMPALQASRPDPVTSLKGAASRPGSRQQFLRSVLVTAQVAVGLVLLIGTGLFARALSRAFAVDLGFGTDHLVTMSVDPGLARLNPERARVYFEEVNTRVASIPGVSGVTWTTATPLTSGLDRESAEVDGYTPAPRERVRFEYNTVGPHYHEVMGITLSAGRGFDQRDVIGAPPVLIVNETAAKRYFAGRSAVGGYATLFGVRFQIIGVARDVKYHELNEEPRPYAYLPMLQMPRNREVGIPTLIMRAHGPAAKLTPSVVDAVRAVNPGVPVFDVATMSDRVRFVLAPQLAGTWLLGVFSALALVVATVGIYGIVAYAVSQRTREIGIRMALGARSSSVIGLVVTRSLAFVLLGIVIGIALAVPLAQVMTRFLYGIGTTDALTLSATSAAMLLVALVASFIPARRTARIDPLRSLRADT